jgi:uncharacterized protein YlzI (FlbEa/FlbD family)
MVNAEEIETVETAHDTIITLRSGRKIIVKENSATIKEKTIEYKKSISEI